MSSKVKFPFIVLAGSPEERDPLMEYADVDYKALIELDGKPLLNYVLDTVIASDRATFILITGIPEELVTLPDTFPRDRIQFLTIKGDLVDKIHGGCAEILRIGKEIPEIYDGYENAIIITGDVPFAKPEAIHDFIDGCAANDFYNDFYHSMVTFKTMEEKFPGSGRSFIHLRDENNQQIGLCGGDIDMLTLQPLVDHYDVLKKVTTNRKFFLKGLWSFNKFFFIRYVLKRVNVSEIEALITHMFTRPSKVIITPHAEIGFDVDKPFQLDMAREYIKKLKSQ
ncbi:MAG: hypothetical protein INQ03_00660 [Candidatus Heimdallarchaeota archaeon]|nr:hypothetical protein [Candidatus Heimdallarchaeota archaeon]